MYATGIMDLLITVGDSSWAVYTYYSLEANPLGTCVAVLLTLRRLGQLAHRLQW